MALPDKTLKLCSCNGTRPIAGSLRRLQMCGDCRVADMVESKGAATIFDYPT